MRTTLEARENICTFYSLPTQSDLDSTKSSSSSISSSIFRLPAANLRHGQGRHYSLKEEAMNVEENSGLDERKVKGRIERKERLRVMEYIRACCILESPSTFAYVAFSRHLKNHCKDPRHETGETLEPWIRDIDILSRRLFGLFADFSSAASLVHLFFSKLFPNSKEWPFSFPRIAPPIYCVRGAHGEDSHPRRMTHFPISSVLDPSQTDD